MKCTNYGETSLFLHKLYRRGNWIDWLNYESTVIADYCPLERLIRTSPTTISEGSVTSENRVRDLKSQLFLCDFIISGVIL